ncbi:hypothetical protein WCQ02_28385 [Paraburkholderia tropica]|uniref:hypothetical protein n=1 Tax=Paraburkholderia tropica TaxID=92647 RepID=UPI000A8D5FB4
MRFVDFAGWQFGLLAISGIFFSDVLIILFGSLWPLNGHGGFAGSRPAVFLFAVRVINADALRRSLALAWRTGCATLHAVL